MNIPYYARIVMLIFIFHPTVECSSPKTDEIVRKNAASQLDRLALFRKSVKLDKSDEDVKSEQKLATNKLDDLKNSTTTEFTIPIELLQYVRKHFSADAATDPETKKRADELLSDPTYNAIMLDRIKRGHSGSFLSGIASKLVGGIASASAGSSSSSSQSNNQAYGNSYSQNAQKFDIWDFKKAVLNTLLQAVKAISGSVVALKGQIVKGGGFLISTKGKLISSAGEVITNLGRNLASSALIAAPKPQQTYPYPSDHQNRPYGHSQNDDYSSDLSGPSASFGSHTNLHDSSEEFDAVKTTDTNIKEYNFENQNVGALDDNYGQKGVSLAGLLSSTIEPPRQEHLHGLDAFSFNHNRPLDFHPQLNYPKDHYDNSYSTVAPVRDPATNLVNHILQETSLNYQNLNNFKVRPNDYYQGSPSFTSYGKVQPNYAPNYPPMKPQQSDSNLQPPQLPLLPHLNPDDLVKIQQYERNKGYPSSGLPASQEPLKIPLFQLDQPAQNWPSAPGQYPYKDQKQSTFDIQAAIDITPGDLRDGKYKK